MLNIEDIEQNDLERIFINQGKGSSNSGSADEKRIEKEAIRKQFWKDWENEPAVLAILGKAVEISERHSKIVAYKNSNTEINDLHSAGLNCAFNAIPFCYPDVKSIFKYLNIRIQGAINDCVRKGMQEDGVGCKKREVFIKLGKLEQELGAKFLPSDSTHVKLLEDIGITLEETFNVGSQTISSLNNENTEGFRLYDILENTEVITPEGYAIQDDLFDKFEKALKSLTDKQRSVFLLHHIDGMTLKEIMDELGLKKTDSFRQLGKANKIISEELGVSMDVLKRYNSSDKRIKIIEARETSIPEPEKEPLFDELLL